jgi:hypothetical protein
MSWIAATLSAKPVYVPLGRRQREESTTLNMKFVFFARQESISKRDCSHLHAGYDSLALMEVGQEA